LILISLLLLLPALVLLAILHRRHEWKRTVQELGEKQAALEKGRAKGRLQTPEVDLQKCIGCGACLDVCPEGKVFSLIHGQAIVVQGALCVGHGFCAAACPVGGIAVTVSDLETRRDLPVLGDHFEAVGCPGLFLAGELTGFALVKTAIQQGQLVAQAILQRKEKGARKAQPSLAFASSEKGGLVQKNLLPQDSVSEELDLVIVGSGPAGLSCALEAKQAGLRFVVLEREAEIGGTVARYPRRKMVLTQPVKIPGFGVLKKKSIEKEELIQLWKGLAEKHELPIYFGQELQSLNPEAGGYRIRTQVTEFWTPQVCLALGRRGTPRKLEVSGEDLPKVAYSLLDARSYQDEDILVVGGGDSAVEAAVGLATQTGNRVVLSYRRKAFNRIKARNEAKLEGALKTGRLKILFESRVLEIQEEHVRLQMTAKNKSIRIRNRHVFIFAGGIPPFGQLEEAGVSFDPEVRKAMTESEPGRGLVTPLLAVLLLALGGLLFWKGNEGYFGLSLRERVLHSSYEWLAPGRNLGLLLGLLGTGAILMNLFYLVRKSRMGSWIPGNLRAWMNFHVGTGILSLLLIYIHAGGLPRQASGGFAFFALCVLVVTGGIGRWFYAFVPRAANGRELQLDEVRNKLRAIASEWDTDQPGIGVRIQSKIEKAIQYGAWRHSFRARLMALLRARGHLRKLLAEVEAELVGSRLGKAQMRRILLLTRRAYRAAMAAAHFEEIRGLLATWRYLHRWVALLMVLLALLHVIDALRYARLDLGLLLGGKG
jgi:thioredoxin reductase/ferredoxin